MEIGLILAIVAAGAVLLAVSKSIRVVQQSECIVLERFGSYHRTLVNGLNFILPFVDQPRRTFWILNGYVTAVSRLDLRETVLDVDKQAVITRDNVSIEIDALLYIQVVDPVKVTYEVSNLPIAVSQLAQTSLRNVIGEMDLDETLASRDIINSRLKSVLDEATDKWGTKVNRVELKNITPPREIQIAMEKQMQAERERRAIVLEAEGEKQARIARSEGLRQEQINIANGDREANLERAAGIAGALRKVAEAKKDALAHVQSVLGDTHLTTQYLVATNYLEEFGKFMQKEGDKVFVPYEASTALGALGSIQALLAEKVTSTPKPAPRDRA